MDLCSIHNLVGISVLTRAYYQGEFHKNDGNIRNVPTECRVYGIREVTHLDSLLMKILLYCDFFHFNSQPLKNMSQHNTVTWDYCRSI